MNTDLSTDLVVRLPEPISGQVEPFGLIFPDATGEIAALDDLEQLARWRRQVTDLKYDALRPAEALANEAIYRLLDQDGVYTVRVGDLEISGESRGVVENAVVVDAHTLHADLMVLRTREHRASDEATVEDALRVQRQTREFADQFFKVELTLTAAGRRRLEAMGGAYRATLDAHTQPDGERRRKAPTVRRVKP